MTNIDEWADWDAAERDDQRQQMKREGTEERAAEARGEDFAQELWAYDQVGEFPAWMS